MSESNADLVRAGYDAFGRGDMDVVMQFLQDTEWHEAEGAPQGGVYTGSEAILNGVFGPLMQQVPGFKATPHEILSCRRGPSARRRQLHRRGLRRSAQCSLRPPLDGA